MTVFVLLIGSCIVLVNLVPKLMTVAIKQAGCVGELGGALWHHWVVCVGFQDWGVEGGGQVDLGDGELSCHVQF